MSWVAVVGGVVSIAAGVINNAKAKKASQAAAAQRTPYKTPKELIEIVNASKGQAQQGLDPATLSYLTNQNDRSFASSIETAGRLGADPNLLSMIFDRNIQNTGQIAAENHKTYMENFMRYLGAEKSLADSKDAEWASSQGIIKDRQQAAQADRNAAGQSINSGLGNIVQGFTNYEIAKLYKQQDTKITPDVVPNYVAAPDLNISSSQYRQPRAQIGATIVGYDQLTGKPIYG